MYQEKQKRYSRAELQSFESMITERLEKANRELEAIVVSLGRKQENSTDVNIKMLEDGVEVAEKERMSQLAARQRKFIKELEAALVRIKHGTYGICIITGELISKARLESVPHTRHSIAVKLSGRAESR